MLEPLYTIETLEHKYGSVILKDDRSEASSLSFGPSTSCLSSSWSERSVPAIIEVTTPSAYNSYDDVDSDYDAELHESLYHIPSKESLPLPLLRLCTEESDPTRREDGLSSATADTTAAVTPTQLASRAMMDHVNGPPTSSDVRPPICIPTTPGPVPSVSYCSTLSLERTASDLPVSSRCVLRLSSPPQTPERSHPTQATSYLVKATLHSPSSDGLSSRAISSDDEVRTREGSHKPEFLARPGSSGSHHRRVQWDAFAREASKLVLAASRIISMLTVVVRFLLWAFPAASISLPTSTVQTLLYLCFWAELAASLNTHRTKLSPKVPSQNNDDEPEKPFHTPLRCAFAAFLNYEFTHPGEVPWIITFGIMMSLLRSNLRDLMGLGAPIPRKDKSDRLSAMPTFAQCHDVPNKA